jgi:hypothetical protein
MVADPPAKSWFLAACPFALAQGQSPLFASRLEKAVENPVDVCRARLQHWRSGR